MQDGACGIKSLWEADEQLVSAPRDRIGQRDSIGLCTALLRLRHCHRAQRHKEQKEKCCNDNAKSGWDTAWISRISIVSVVVGHAIRSACLMFSTAICPLPSRLAQGGLRPSAFKAKTDPKCKTLTPSLSFATTCPAASDTAWHRPRPRWLLFAEPGDLVEKGPAG